MSLQDAAGGGAEESTGFVAARKINEASLVPNLLFAFFGHRPDYVSITELQSPERVRALDDLTSVLNIIFNAIKEKRFNRVHASWITDEVMQENFEGRSFNQYYGWIRTETTPYTKKKSIKFRFTMAAIATVARELYRPGAQLEPALHGLRETLLLEEPTEAPEEKATREQQVRLLGNIELALQAIDNRPQGAISFDDKDQPVIKIKRGSFFPMGAELAKYEPIVEGRFLVFRKVFEPLGDGAEFTREHLVIDRKPFGITFRCESRGNDRGEMLIIAGVVFFTKGGFWLIGHSARPFQRMRMFAADIKDWAEHHDHKKTFCEATILTHRIMKDTVQPVTRIAVLRRETKDSFRDEPYDKRCRFLTREEAKAMLTREEFELIDQGS
jgi:hypothetical protein